MVVAPQIYDGLACVCSSIQRIDYLIRICCLAVAAKIMQREMGYYENDSGTFFVGKELRKLFYLVVIDSRSVSIRLAVSCRSKSVDNIVVAFSAYCSNFIVVLNSIRCRAKTPVRHFMVPGSVDLNNVRRNHIHCIFRIGPETITANICTAHVTAERHDIYSAILAIVIIAVHLGDPSCKAVCSRIIRTAASAVMHIRRKRQNGGSVRCRPGGLGYCAFANGLSIGRLFVFVVVTVFRGVRRKDGCGYQRQYHYECEQ